MNIFGGLMDNNCVRLRNNHIS